MSNKSIFWLSLLLLSACTKIGKNITVKGRVYDPISGEGIKNIEILINNEQGKVKSAKSDANGEFEVSKLGGKQDYTVESQFDDSYFYKLAWSKKGKLDYSPEVLMTKGKTNHIDLLLIPYGNIIWNVKNVNCEDSTDNMYYQIKYQYNSDFQSSYEWREFGCSDYSKEKVKMLTGKYIVKMEISRPSGNSILYDTFYVSKDVVNTYNMEY